jgi:hypothetical protein
VKVSSVGSLLLKGLAVAALVGAVIVPAASAKSHAAVKLSIIPLQKSQLGSAASALSVSIGSGPQSNQGSPKLKRLGRITGYQLIYGNLVSAGSGLDVVQTSVDKYKTAADAKRALPFWKKLTLGQTDGLSQLDLTAGIAQIPAPRIGEGRWGTLETYSISNNTSLYYVNEEFADGRYVLDLAVGAGSESFAKAFASKTAHALARRLVLAVAGRLHGHPAKLPKRPKAGPPATGPDPAALVLTASDLPSSTLRQEGYDWAPVALSTYDAEFSPAGPFGDLFQTVSVMPTSVSAAYSAAFNGAGWIAGDLFFAGPAFTKVTRVDVSSAGDNAQAAMVEISGGGQTLNEAVITLNTGPASDLVVGDSATAIDPGDVQNLAQTAASRLNTGLGT